MRKLKYAVAACLLLLSLFLLNTKPFSKHKEYVTHVKGSVSGLKENSLVEYNGVVIGKVKSIDLDANNIGTVDVLLSVKENTPITAGTKASLSFDQTTNKTFVKLTDQGDDKTKVIIKPKQSYPEIYFILSDNSNQEDKDLKQISTELTEMNKTVQAFLSTDNIEAFKQLLYSLQVVMGMLAENRTRLDNIIVNTDKASSQIKDFLNTSQNTIKILQSQTLPAAYMMLNNSNNLVNRVSDLIYDINQNPAVLIRGKAPLKPGPGE